MTKINSVPIILLIFGIFIGAHMSLPPAAGATQAATSHIANVGSHAVPHEKEQLMVKPHTIPSLPKNNDTWFKSCT